ncbi:MAG TPA: hypothetical protein PK530_10980 [Anaerolineales bacterium]|nr:hypothetical protein [Anaerolineales bacterium]
MSRTDKLALLLSLIAIFAAWGIARNVFENIPHLEDELAYVWQAKIMAAGEVTIPSPVEPKKFLVPFVVDYEPNGQRFGKYPLGWPALLAVGIMLGVREWVNPLLAGLAVWLTYVLGKRLMNERALGERVGLLAALLTVTSPFFLVNVGSLLSHAWGLVLSLGFVVAWWEAVGSEGAGEQGGKGEKEKRGREEGVRWFAAVTAGTALGMLAVTRPFSAIGVAIPFGLHGLVLLVKGPKEVRGRVIVVGLLMGLVSLLVPLWQAVATGDPFLNPYTLWWPYDKVGFGPGHGVSEQGHTLRQGWINTKFALRVAYSDVFGWPKISWIFLPFGMWAVRRNGKMLLTGSVFLSLLGLYFAYWIGAWLFGPRYQFEGLYSLTLLSAAGIAWLAGWGREGEKRREGEEEKRGMGKWQKVRSLGITALVALLFVGNLIFYLPTRLDGMFALYGISAARMEPFLSPEVQKLAPAVIIVHGDKWMDYGNFLELEDPFLTTPFIFTFGDKSTLKDALQATYPERGIYHYYPDSEPYKFFTDRVPELTP